MKRAHFRLPSASQKRACVRRLERVFRCCSVCGTMEGYKEGYLMVWANYMSTCNSIAGLYFEGTSYQFTMAMQKVHKNVHLISVFENYLKNLFGDLPFLFLCWKVS